MSFLIKWKLEKLLKRRDFGEITRNSQSEIALKSAYSETSKRDGRLPRLDVSRFHA